MKISSKDSRNITETIRGIVDRVTYHNETSGWSVLRVLTFGNYQQQETVTVHQTKVFAGATMEFAGVWTYHSKFGRQFKAHSATELKPASSAALERYLGSGLIKGVGPKTAKKIVSHFGDRTLEVFEDAIEKLVEVPGIAHKKLKMITAAWAEHRAIRDVMIFLQSHGISTLYAVRIYKEYGDNAISIVSSDPYRLAVDFYGIGFFSADRVAISLGIAHDSPLRIVAAIKHVLSASRDLGHCFLTASQIENHVHSLIDLKVDQLLSGLLLKMESDGMLMVRHLMLNDRKQACYYSKSLYFDELYVAKKLRVQSCVIVDFEKVEAWMTKYCSSMNIQLSNEQAHAVKNIVKKKYSVLTGGPGCGKTTATLVLVKLLEAMNLKVLLAAPTGRAAQRMSDVVGQEAKTIHRMLEWKFGSFSKNEESPLDVDFLIIDECSMLDINLTASLLKAVPTDGQVLFIGDADQLPSVGAGNVLHDIIASATIACFNLTEIFRQAKESLIIKHAHQINMGKIPHIDSPFNKPEIWKQNTDCIFMDSDEATKEQLRFISRVKSYSSMRSQLSSDNQDVNYYEYKVEEPMVPYESEFLIPPKFKHVKIDNLLKAQGKHQELISVMKKIHPWSSLYYGLSAAEVVRKLYTEWIPKYLGNREIQILTPMTRGTLGTVNLNKMIQNAANPVEEGKRELKIGERLFREGDRVIHRKNNYDLGVFNGDIGIISNIDTEYLTCTVSFYPDSREILYQRDNIVELDLAYAITIHKSQGSEFEVVIIPVLSQHFKMLFRNLIYTGLTRARKFVAFVGTRKALAMAVKNKDTSQRQTALKGLIAENY